MKTSTMILSRLAQAAFVPLILYGLYGGIREHFPVLTHKQAVLILVVVGVVWVRPGFDEKSDSSNN